MNLLERSGYAPGWHRSSVLVLLIGTLVLAGLPLQAEAQQVAPDVPFTTVSGDTLSVGDFQGEKVMLWLLSTWCGSCRAGLTALQAKQQTLARQNVRVLMLKNHKNGGYEAGPSITELARQTAPSVLEAENWTLGIASKKLMDAYNPRPYPDIYYLIGPEGRIRTQSGAPGGTLEKILTFAESR